MITESSHLGKQSDISLTLPNDQLNKKIRRLIRRLIVFILFVKSIIYIFLILNYSFPHIIHFSPTCHGCNEKVDEILQYLNPAKNPCNGFFDYTCGNMNNSLVSMPEYVRMKVNKQMKQLLESKLDIKEMLIVKKLQIMYESCLRSKVLPKMRQLFDLTFELFNQLKWPLFEDESSNEKIPWEVYFSYLLRFKIPTILTITKHNYHTLGSNVITITNKNAIDLMKMDQLEKNLMILLPRLKSKGVKNSMNTTMVESIQNIFQLQRDLINLNIIQNITIIQSNYTAFIEQFPEIQFDIIFEVFNKSNLKIVYDPSTIQTLISWKIDDRKKRNNLKNLLILHLIQFLADVPMDCIVAMRKEFVYLWNLVYVNKFTDNENQKVVKDMVKLFQNELLEHLKTIDHYDQKSIKWAMNQVNKIEFIVGWQKRHKDIKFLNSILPFKKCKFLKNNFVHNLMCFRNYTTVDKEKNDADIFSFRDHTIVNAYYISTLSKIVLMLPLLEPPYFHRDYPTMLNYAGTGVIIGHEIGHSIDAMHLNRLASRIPWKIKKDFETDLRCFVRKYGNYSMQEKDRLTFVDPVKTLNENIADMIGLELAYRTFQKTYKNCDQEGWAKPFPNINFTLNQFFFLRYVQLTCSKKSAFYSVHAPGFVRVRGSLSNFPSFAEAFHCPLGTSMNHLIKCKLWYRHK